jgi:hypothetical protein
MWLTWGKGAWSALWRVGLRPLPWRAGSGRWWRGVMVVDSLLNELQV